MPELRWILTVFGFVLLIGIYVWGRRGAKSGVDASSDARAHVAAPSESYEPVVDDTALAASAEPKPEEDRWTLERDDLEENVEPVTERWDAAASSNFHAPTEKTIEAAVPRARESRHSRIEPTFGDDNVTAELPVQESEPVIAARAAEHAPTLSMSSTPPPRRIERRKIIALRLALSPQRVSGAQLKAALDAESLQYGKYNVFHSLDEQGATLFSVASMVEPGTFDLEKMEQEAYPGITLFTQLPGPAAGMLAFNELVACARRLHASLGGTLQDERGVPLTVHRVERIRQEIREFEHRPAGEVHRSTTFSPSP